MNNKTIIEFSFRIIWRIMEIEEGVIRQGVDLGTTEEQIHLLVNKDSNPGLPDCESNALTPPKKVVISSCFLRVI